MKMYVPSSFPVPADVDGEAVLLLEAVFECEVERQGFVVGLRNRYVECPTHVHDLAADFDLMIVHEGTVIPVYDDDFECEGCDAQLWCPISKTVIDIEFSIEPGPPIPVGPQVITGLIPAPPFALSKGMRLRIEEADWDEPLQVVDVTEEGWQVRSVRPSSGIQ